MEQTHNEKTAIMAGVVLALCTYETWLLNQAIFPTTSLVFPLAREIQTLAGIIAGLFILVAAARKPRLLKPKPLLILSVTCALLGLTLLLGTPFSALGTTVGLVLLAWASALPSCLGPAMLSFVSSPRVISVTAACAVLASTVAGAVTPHVGYVAGCFAMTLIALVCTALVWHTTQPILESTSTAEGTELLALANPRSFLSPSHQVYVLMLIFSLAFGFALSLNIADNTPVANPVRLVVLAIVTAWFVLSPATRPHEDALFRLSALLAVAGFLVTPACDVLPVGCANALLYAGNSCFAILSSTALAALCARNPLGAMVVLACGKVASSVGTFIGADLGHACNALLRTPDATTLLVACIVLALFAYVLVGLRGFSFAETIRGIEPATIPVPAQASMPTHEEMLDTACDALAAERGLTAREREVFGMLARGHNGYHIRDELTLSYNTVKTHVKRIYRKLDVHSQQELIDLVEARADEDAD